MGRAEFELFLFSTDAAFIPEAVAAGVAGIIVDWEQLGKRERQAAADTQINQDTLDDLRRVRACTDARVICRINESGPQTAREVDDAIEAGADEILLPMVRTVTEVDALLAHVNGRCGVGILIETIAATMRAWELARLPLSRVYVGLNDLAIERRTPCIFAAIADGTVERVRAAFQVPFGLAGLTLVDRGFPIPCRLLIGEMARLRCGFSFLRRSFHRDIRGREPALEIPRLLEELHEARGRSADEVVRDRQALELAIDEWAQSFAGAQGPSAGRM